MIKATPMTIMTTDIARVEDWRSWPGSDIPPGSLGFLTGTGSSAPGAQQLGQAPTRSMYPG